jgi:hypothetical protein
VPCHDSVSRPRSLHDASLSVRLVLIGFELCNAVILRVNIILSWIFGKFIRMQFAPSLKSFESFQHALSRQCCEVLHYHGKGHNGPFLLQHSFT